MYKSSASKKNSVLISILLTFLVSVAGCSSLSNQYIVDRDCPTPSQDQLNENGYLVIQKGVTLKCQVKNYTNKMSCQGITDGEDERLLCNNGSKSSLFVFDKNGILKAHKIY
jgi:uncharacterized lipoprotein YajG